jgi:hypothetical protein
MTTSAFRRGFDRGQKRRELQAQQAFTPQRLRLVELRIEAAITARRTAKHSTITNDDLESLMLEWSIIREAMEKQR